MRTDYTLEQAREAVETAKSKEPSLTQNGLDGDHERHYFDDRSLQQVRTALIWLSQLEKTKNAARYSSGYSYGLKHQCESWGRENGLEPYVSNGALIAAAIFLGFPYKVDDLNAFIGISRRSLREVRSA